MRLGADLRQFDEIQSAAFGPQFGSSGVCKHPPTCHMQRANGSAQKSSWRLRLLAQYAVSHYLEQDRVLDADVVEDGSS